MALANKRVATRREGLVGALAVGFAGTLAVALLVALLGEAPTAAQTGDSTVWVLDPPRLAVIALMLGSLLAATAYASFRLLHLRRIAALQHSVDRIDAGAPDPTPLEGLVANDAVGRAADALHRLVAEIRDRHDALRDENARLAAAGRAQAEHDEHLIATWRSRLGEYERGAHDLSVLAEKLQGVVGTARGAVDSTTDAEQQANEVTDLVSQTMESVTGMAAEVEQGASAINQLAEDNKKITEIVDVIRKITEQTNMLALNAAIEAARAGQHGRGFAVVADEVRKLSTQTRTAAEQIQQRVTELQSSSRAAAELINRSCDQAEMTIFHAMNAQERVAAIAEGIGTIHQANLEISASMSALSSEGDEIAKRISSLSERPEVTVDDAEPQPPEAELQALPESINDTPMRAQG